MASSEARVIVTTLPTFAKVLVALLEAMETVVKLGACLSNVTPPSRSFTNATTCVPSLLAISLKSTVKAIGAAAASVDAIV